MNVRNRDHSVIARVQIPSGGAEGALLVQGSVLGGWSFHLIDSTLRYVHNLNGLERHEVSGPAELEPGEHTLELRFTRTGEHRGQVRLLVDGTQVGEGEVPRFTMTRFSLTGAGLLCGRASGLPPTDDYDAPFAFTGQIEEVVVEVDGEPFVDPEGEAEIAIATQ